MTSFAVPNGDVDSGKLFTVIMDVPENIVNFLAYRQESVSRSKWITTANGYL